MISREIKRDILSYDEMQSLITIVVDSVDLEFSRILEEKEKEIISDFLAKLYVNTQYFAFFVPQSLELLTINIMETAAIRDYILNLTDRVNATICYDESDMDKLIKTLVLGYCRNRTETVQYSLIAKEINESIAINEDVLSSLMKNNFWILLVYLLTFNLHKTALFQTST